MNVTVFREMLALLPDNHDLNRVYLPNNYAGIRSIRNIGSSILNRIARVLQQNMNTIDLVRDSQQGDADARELVQQYSNLEYTTPDDLASAIASRETSISNDHSPQPVSDDALIEVISEFHTRAGTMTDAVSEELNKLQRDTVRLRLAHQPDLLPYRGVIAQFLLLNATQEKLYENHDQQCCQLYFIVDHDIAESHQFRVAHFPDPFDNQGMKSMSLSLSSEKFSSTMESVPAPDRAIVKDWISTVHDAAVLHNSHIDPKNPHGLHPDKMSKNIDFIRELLDADQARNGAEFNAIVISRIVNNVLDIPTLFVPLSKLSEELVPHYEYLLGQWPKIKESGQSVAQRLADMGVNLSSNLVSNIQKIPFWYVCPSCNSRLQVNKKPDGKIECAESCNSCGTMINVSFGTIDEPDLSEYGDEIAPRVVMDNLLDVIGFDIAGGVGYESSVEHVLLTHGIDREIGWSAPVECYWRPFGLLGSPTEAVAKTKLSETEGAASTTSGGQRALELIYNGRASICYDLVYKGENVLNRWKDHFKNNGDITTPVNGWSSTEWFSPNRGDH